MSAVDAFLKSRTAAAPEDLPDDIPDMDSDYNAKHKRAAVYYPLIDRFAKEHPDVPDLASYAKAMMLRESGGNPRATSSANARGLLQLTPGTYEDMGGDPENAYDPVDNLQRGVGYIAKQYREFGDWDNALAAYNWGPGNVDRHGIDNLPPETANYLKAVNGYRKRLQGTTAEAFFASKMGGQANAAPTVGLGQATDSFFASRQQDKPSLDGFQAGPINLFPNRQNVYNPPVEGPDLPPPEQPPIPFTHVPPSLAGFQAPKGGLLQPKILDPVQVQGSTPIARPGSQGAYIPTPIAGFGKGVAGAVAANGAAIPESPGEAPYRLAGDIAGQFAVQAPPFLLGPEIGLPAAGAYQMLRSGNEQKTRNPNRPVDVAEAGAQGALGAAGAGLPAAAGRFLLTKMVTGAAFGGAQGAAGQAIDQLAEKGKIDLTDPQTWKSALTSAGLGAAFGAFHKPGTPMVKEPYRGDGVELTPENTPGFVEKVGDENPTGPLFQRRPDFVDPAQTPTAHPPDEAPMPKTQGSEPWQMTSGRYNIISELAGKETSKGVPSHYDLVKQAVEEGKPVPANVLAEYPNLTAKPEGPQADVLHVGQYTRNALLSDDGRTIRINPQDEKRAQLYLGQASNPDKMASQDKWRIMGAPVKIDKNAPTLEDVAHGLNQKLRFEGKSAAEAAGQEAKVNTGRYAIAGADKPDADYGYSADDLMTALIDRPRSKEAMAEEIQKASKSGAADYNVGEAEAFYRLPKEEQDRLMSQMAEERRTEFQGPEDKEWNPYLWDIPERQPEAPHEPQRVIPFPEERTAAPGRVDRVRRDPESNEPPRVFVSNRLQKVAEGIASGRITPDEARETMERLAETLDQNRMERQDTKMVRPRERGVDIIEEKLLAARRRGELDSEGVELARWVMHQNPSIVDDLGISVRQMNGRAAGQYNPLNRIIQIAKHSSNSETVTHEIMHHTERMMPQEIRQGILQEYAKAWSRAFTNAPFSRLQALEKIARANNGDARAQQEVMRGFGDGSIPRNMYQLANPSEFWAVNSSRILSGRYQAQQRGWVATARQWFKEFIQHLKASVGLKSDSAVIRGLRSVLRGDGEFVTNRQLFEHQQLERPLMSLKPEEAKGPQVGPQSQKAKERFEKMMARSRKGLGEVVNYGGNKISSETGWQSRAERAYTWYVNEAEPLEKIGRIARHLGDAKLARQLKYAVNRVLGSGGSANVYIKERLFPIFQGGTLDGIKFEKLTPEEGRLVDAYALSKDTLWRLEHAEGFDNPALTREHAMELLAEHEKLDPKTKFKVEQAAQGLTTYAKDLARKKMEAGLPDWAPEKFNAITANPYYIPEIRDFESVYGRPMGKTAKRQFTSTNRLMRGNFETDEVVPIFDPVTSLVHDTHEFEAESAKMAVWNTVLEMSEKHPELQNWIKRKPASYETNKNIEEEVPILRPRETHLEPEQARKAEEYQKAAAFLEKAKDRVWQQWFMDQHQIRVHEKINRMPPDRRQMLGADMDQILKDVQRNHEAWIERERVKAEKTIDAFRKIPEAERYKMEDYLNEGKPQTWIVPKEIGQAVNGMGPLEFVGLEKFIVNVASLFRRFQVGYNIDFSGANVPRDMQEAYINAKMPFWYAWKGLYHYIKKDDVYKAYMQHGGSMEGDESGMRASADIGQEIRYGDRFLKDRYRRVFDKAPWEERKLVSAFGREIAIPGQAARVGEAFKQTGKIALDASEIASEAGEMMTRLAVMDYSMKKMKLDPSAAADAARQATLDFKRIGSKMKSWNARIPFLNARIQGMDRSIRNVKDDPWKAATRIALVSVAPMAMLQAWNMRNPNYKDIPAWEKEYYWIIMDPHGQGYTKIAKGQVAQLLNPLQMVMENWTGTANEKAWQIASSWFANAAPVSEATGFVSPVEKAVLEENAGEGGYDFYTQRPIVKTPGARPADQWDANTPETLKKVGRALNISPQMWQHRLKSIMGGTAGNMLFVTDLLLGHPPKDPAAIPVIRRFRGQTEEWKSDLSEQKRKLLHEKTLKEDALKSFKGEYMRAAKEPNPADLRRQISEKRKNTMKDLVDVMHKLGQAGSALDSLNHTVDSLNAVKDYSLGD